MEYAQLIPGRRFAPLHSLLYFTQRVVTPLPLRRLAVRLLTGALRLRHGDGSGLYANTAAEQAALHDLRRSGYAPLGNLLDDERCGEVLAYLGDKPLVDRDRARAGFTLAQRPGDVRVADYHLHDIIDCPHLLELANSPALLGLAARYLGCKPTISALGLRWSFPVQGSSVLQAYHRDAEDWRYLKIFLYLTDVDEQAGPHVCLYGSHRTRAPLRLRYYTDADIEAAYGREMLLAATGTRGFCFAVDTAGIHKGASPVARARLMLQIQYSLLPGYAYRYQPEIYRGTLDLDPYVNRLVLRRG